jgi:hypothetical protein
MAADPDPVAPVSKPVEGGRLRRIVGFLGPPAPA